MQGFSLDVIWHHFCHILLASTNQGHSRIKGRKLDYTMSGSCGKAPLQKSTQHGIKGKQWVFWHFYIHDNKLKPFSCKCDITLDGFPWQSAERPILNRSRELGLGEQSPSPEQPTKGARKSICWSFRITTQLHLPGAGGSPCLVEVVLEQAMEFMLFFCLLKTDGSA